MLKVLISEGQGERFSVQTSAEKFFKDFFSDEENFVGNIKVEGEFVKDGSSLIIRGKIFCRKVFLCDRCLAKTQEDQVHEFDEEIDKFQLTSDVLDISELVRDVLVAAQPIQNLCKPDCKGLCPNCGKPLEGECTCNKRN